MGINQRRKNLLRVLNFDLFHDGSNKLGVSQAPPRTSLPDSKELDKIFEILNWHYFNGHLPKIPIQWSNRMKSAGLYLIDKRMIRLGRKYHEFYPEEIEDTLKHEMLHILYPTHNASFLREAGRIGASRHAKDYPGAKEQHRYVYFCPACGEEYPRHRRLREASCGKCSKTGYNPTYKLRLKATPLRKVAKG